MGADETDDLDEKVFYIDDLQPVIDISCLPSRCFRGRNRQRMRNAKPLMLTMTQLFFLTLNPLLTWQAWARTAATSPSIRSHLPAAVRSSKRSWVQAWATMTRQRVLQGSTHSWMTHPATSKQVTNMLRRDHRLNQPAAKVQPLLCWLLLFFAFCLTWGFDQRLPVVLLLQSRILHCQDAVVRSVGSPSLLSAVHSDRARSII